MPTVTFLKSTLQAQIAPGDDERFLRLLTEADMKLLEMVRFRWTRTKITLDITDGLVVLPARYAGILAAQVDGAAVDIHDPTFEFVPGGVGDVEVNGATSVMLIDQGLNDEELRHYKVTGSLPDDVTVRAWVHYAPAMLFDPDYADSSVPDEAVSSTICPHTSALKLAMLGLIYEEEGNIEKSGGFFKAAMKALDEREGKERGGAMPQVNLRRSVGTRRVRSFR